MAGQLRHAGWRRQKTCKSPKTVWTGQSSLDRVLITYLDTLVLFSLDTGV
jgi:hypothetical protein